VGPTAGLDMVAKRKISSPHQESNPNDPDHPARILITILTDILALRVIVREILEK
jgi:hypothetical protein